MTATIEWLAKVLAGRVVTAVSRMDPRDQRAVLVDVDQHLRDALSPRRPCLHCEGWGCRRCEVRL